MGQLITLITDFGLLDEYVGVMKGVMLSKAPAATIVDLCHAVPRQDIRQAAYRLRAAIPFFPKGTIHVIVVDPDVGMDRRIILLQFEDYFFLAPDNGLLSLFYGEEGFVAARSVECEELFLQPLSATFHGRDVFAPVAAALAAGMEPEKVGPVVDKASLVSISWAGVQVDKEKGRVRGSVTGIDHFGNLLTSIQLAAWQQFGAEAVDPEALVSVRGVDIYGIEGAYSQVESGSLLAIFGSRGFLELAVNQGSAADKLGACVGDLVELVLKNGQ